ncbi:MAG: hypothetical protein NT099_01655 [Candidatus Saganbacteria bacterium]|nr:hypothetical protein [Candidatus Saganbacteria bacterium]
MGSQHYISWEGSGITNVSLKLSLDNGASYPYTVVITTSESTKTYLWTIPDYPTIEAKIKIQEVGGSISDESNAKFTITPEGTAPSIEVTSPATGAQWKVADTNNITWTSSGEIPFVKIEYSKDNFVTDVNTVITSTENDGSFGWEVANDVSDTVKIRISKVGSAEVAGTSGAFGILQPRNEEGELEPGSHVLSYPSVFSPLSGGNVRIVYRLTSNTRIRLYLFDISGQVAWSRAYEPGDNGGRKGYNELTWDGGLDFGGLVGNGVYVLRVTRQGKVIGTGHIVVVD